MYIATLVRPKAWTLNGDAIPEFVQDALTTLLDDLPVDDQALMSPDEFVEMFPEWDFDETVAILRRGKAKFIIFVPHNEDICIVRAG